VSNTSTRDNKDLKAMRVADKIIVVTGGAKGIGQALCDRFHREGAKKVIVADIDIAYSSIVAEAVDGAAY